MFRNLLAFVVSFSFAVAVVLMITEGDFIKYIATAPDPTAIDNPSESKNVEDLAQPHPENSARSPEGNAPRFGLAGVKGDREIVDLFLKFRDAVARSDRDAVESLIVYPLRVNFPDDPDSKGYTFIKNRQSFVRLYDRIFDTKLRTFISNVNPESDDIWARIDGIAIGRGVIWIGTYCYYRKCTDGRYYLGIRTIHGNSHLMDVEE